MAEYRHSAHATFDLKYHVIWITKYRYKILRGRIAERARDLIRQVCEARDVVIIRGAVSPDHIHMLLSATEPYPKRIIYARINATKKETGWSRYFHVAHPIAVLTAGRG